MTTKLSFITKRRRAGFLALVLLAAISLTACFLDRSGLGYGPSEFEVIPAYICPRDPITVRWDVPTGSPCWTGRPTTDGAPSTVP